MLDRCQWFSKWYSNVELVPIHNANVRFMHPSVAPTHRDPIFRLVTLCHSPKKVRSIQWLEHRLRAASVSRPMWISVTLGHFSSSFSNFMQKKDRYCDVEWVQLSPFFWRLVGRWVMVDMRNRWCQCGVALGDHMPVILISRTNNPESNHVSNDRDTSSFLWWLFVVTACEK